MSTVERNDPCPCGSGKKYKKCCLEKAATATSGLQRDRAVAYNNLGMTYLKSGDLESATECFRGAIAVDEGYAEAQYNFGTARLNLGRWEEAVVSFKKAVALKPRYAEAWYNLGTAYGNEGKLDEAVAGFKKALSIRPAYAEAHYNLGTAYMGHGDFDKAVAHFKKAIALKPGYIEAYNNLGAMYLMQGKAEEGASCFMQALALQPDLALAHQNLGNALLSEGQVGAAMERFNLALSLKPELVSAHDSRLFVLNYLSEHTAVTVYEEHCRYAEQFERPLKASWPKHANTRDPERRLRIGYVSPDFRQHSVAYFMEPILAHHDRGVVEVYCYYNHTLQDAVTERLLPLADHWIPCRQFTDEQLAARIAADGIDILVDLAGHTAGNRLLVFARKPAPVQVSYLGYPATTGLTAIDYRLVTAETDPAGAESWHSERLYRLPRSLWCYRPAEDMPAVAAPTPARRNGYVTFGSMNNIAKISDAVVAVWARILGILPTAQLAMTNLSNGAQQLMRERFAAYGIAPPRLHLYGKLARQEFYEVLQGIDIALDPFPYAGTTTTCEALWMGVPVISLTGQCSVSRSGFALLRSIGHEELSVRNEEEYIALAIALARDTDRLDALRVGMRACLESSALCDEAGVTHDIEAAYRQMWRAWC